MSQSIPQDSASKKLFNLVVQSLENCEDENKALVNVVDSCQFAHEKAKAEIESSKSVIVLQNKLIENHEETILMQKEMISNSATILKNTKQVGRLKIFTWTLGGFVIGTSVTSIVMLVRELK